MLRDDARNEALAQSQRERIERIASADWPERPRVPGSLETDALPLDALPAVLRDHVSSVAGATQTPIDMGVMLALGAVSAATRGRYTVRVDARRDWAETVTIYTAVVLPSASRKSPVYAAMTRPIEEWERSERERIGPSHREARDRADVCRAALEKAKQEAARGKGTQLVVSRARKDLTEAEQAIPVPPRVVVSDVTSERVVQLLKEHGGSLAVMGPEADLLSIADGKYSDSARIDELLRAYVGESITVDRVGREADLIPRAVLTVAIAMQPAALASVRHGPTHRGRGLYARVLWAMPPHGLGQRLTGRDVPPVDGAAGRRYKAMITRLLEAGLPSDTVELRLAEDALDVVYEYEAEIERELAEGGALESIRDWAGKAVGQAVRLATLMALARRADEGTELTASIGADDVRGGVALVRALTTHARAVLDSLDPASPEAKAAYVLRRAREIGGGKTTRDLHEATRSKKDTGLIKTVEDLEPVLANLVERGCIRIVEQDHSGRGRPPSPVVEIHPLLDDSARLRDPQNPQNRDAAVSAANSAGSAGRNGVVDRQSAPDSESVTVGDSAGSAGRNGEGADCESGRSSVCPSSKERVAKHM